MAYVRIEQRNARLVQAVKVETVKGREGDIPRGTVTIISNVRHGTGPDRTEEPTAIQWTLWGKQAENAGQYLTKGSRVNVVGRLRNDRYTDGEGREVYGFSFTCEEIDYLDSKNESDARKGRQEWAESYEREQTETQGRRPTARGQNSAASKR